MVRPSAIASGGRSRAIAVVQEMTQGGAESVLECVSSESAMATAIGIARPGRAIGYVDLPCAFCLLLCHHYKRGN